jgi:uncharacterized protein
MSDDLAPQDTSFMKIYLSELSENETDLDFTQDEAWVRQSVEKLDEEQSEGARSELESMRAAASAGKSGTAKSAAPRPIHVHFSLRKVDDVVVLSGEIDTHVRLMCSRCANMFNLKCQSGVSGLFCKDPVMAGVGYLNGETHRPSGQNKGYARHAHDEGADEEISQGKDLDITYLSNDYVDLSEVLTEHLQLQVPFQPLCREDCKGMCSQCGADLNTGRCACAKIVSSKPFSVLKDLKL